MSNNSNLPSGGTGAADTLSDADFEAFMDEDAEKGTTEPEGDEDADADADAALEAADADEGEGEGKDDDAEDAENQEGGPKSDPVVKLDDGTELKLSELAAGYQRQQDYTRKTQELAGSRKEFEASVARYGEHARQREKQLDEAFEDVTAVLSAVMPKRPEPSLAYTDPVAYAQSKAIYDASLEQINAIIGSHREARGKLAAAAEQQQSMDVEAEMKKVIAAFPVAGDPVKGKAFWQAALETGKSLGFTSEELAQADSRQVIVLAELARYRAREKARDGGGTATLKGGKPAISAPKPPAVTTRQQAPQSSSTKALRSFRETRSVRDAERAWANMDI